MYRVIFILLLSSSILLSSLIGSNYNKRDLEILEEFDIDKSYITDYYLQKTYNQFLELNKKNYVKKLNDASLFSSLIKQILVKEGIPSSFLYLAMAESYLKVDSFSNAKAAGIWQFVPSTAKKYGLKNDLYIDERLDLVKSTQAAAKHLKYLNRLFSKWYLAAIAYNCGEGRVIEAITRATIDKYVQKYGKSHNKKMIKRFRNTIKAYQRKKVKFKELYKIYKIVKKWDYKIGMQDLLTFQKGLQRQYLPKESRKYIRKIISLGMMNNRKYMKSKDNSHLLNIGISSLIATVSLKGGINIKDISKTIAIDTKKLLKLNRHIKKLIIPPYISSYHIYIPYGKLALFNANKHKIKTTSYAIHIVKKGDYLGIIAQKYKIPYKLIKKHNNLKTNILSLKQKLIIPLSKDYVAKQTINYLVKKGDTLNHISKRYKIKLKKLMKDNNKKTTFIKIGDKLVINL